MAHDYNSDDDILDTTFTTVNTPSDDSLHYANRGLTTEIKQLVANSQRDLDDVTKHLHFLQPPSGHSQRKNPPSSSTETNNTPSTTYLDAARLNTTPDKEPTFLPSAPDPTKSMRYGLRITIPKHPQPLELLFKALKDMYRLIRHSTGPIGIGPWDHENRSATVLQRKSDFPDGKSLNKDKNFLQTYFNIWFKAQSDKGEYTCHMKI